MIDGPKELLNYDILKTLLSPTFLFKKTTLMDVRYRMPSNITIDPESSHAFRCGGQEYAGA